jgi:membrane protein DedA with SNARE-associated domain
VWLLGGARGAGRPASRRIVACGYNQRGEPRKDRLTMTAPAWLDNVIMTWGYWAVLVAVMVESMGVPFPGETTLLVAAAYAGTGGSLNIVLVIAAASAGAILGDNIGYLVGRFGGYPLAWRFLRLFHIKPAALESAQDYFARHGDKTVFIGRFIALLRVTVAFMAGVTWMPWRRFLIWNALGGIAWATLYGSLGYILGRNLQLLGEIVRVIGIGGTILAIVAIGGVILFWRRHRQTARLRGVIASDPPADARPTPSTNSDRGAPVRTPRRSGPVARRYAAQRHIS